MADDETYDAGDIVDAELAHQVRAVVLDGLRADVEFHRHFLAREALGQQDRDLLLAFSERGAFRVDVALGRREGVGHRLLEGIAEPGVAGGDGVDRLAELGEAGALRHVAADADLEEAAGELLLGLRGKDEHLEFRLRLVELAEDLEAADARQEDVEDEDVGLELLRQREAFVAVGRRAQHAVDAAGLEHLDDQFADGGLVFHDHDRFRLPGSCLHGGVRIILASSPPQANAKKRRLVTILFHCRVDQSLPDHEPDEAGHVADAQLAHQVGPVVLGGLKACFQTSDQANFLYGLLCDSSGKEERNLLFLLLLYLPQIQAPCGAPQLSRFHTEHLVQLHSIRK